MKEDLWRAWSSMTSLFDDKRPGTVSVSTLVEEVVTSGKVVVVNLSREGLEAGTSIAAGSRNILWNEEIQGMLILRLLSSLRERGEIAYLKGKRLNTMVVLDEAHRFIPKDARRTEGGDTRSFGGGESRNRKYGIGWLLVSQTLASLHQGSFLNSGCSWLAGLNTGSELQALRELSGGDQRAISIYQRFPDPHAALEPSSRNTISCFGPNLAFGLLGSAPFPVCLYRSALLPLRKRPGGRVNLLKGYQRPFKLSWLLKRVGRSFKSVGGSLDARLRETSQRLKDMGCFLPLPPPSNDGPWAVDGAYAATRRLGDAVAIVAVAAALEKGAPLAAGEVHLIPHTPESEFLLRARMIMLELLAAVELVKTNGCPVLLDGSFGSSLVMVNQALRMGSRVDQSLWQIIESLVEPWAEALELVAFEDCR